MTDKSGLRRLLREKRRALSGDEQDAAAAAVFERLCAHPAYRQARTVMAYMAARGELSLAPVIEDVLRTGKTLLLPRCDAPGEMSARWVDGLQQLTPAAYGVLAPDEACAMATMDQIDLVLVPGVAFGKDGGRVGQGGGYYDRFLPKTDALRIGICHGFALLECVPRDAHDAAMDIIITPQATVVCRGYTSDFGRNGHG